MVKCKFPMHHLGCYGQRISKGALIQCTSIGVKCVLCPLPFLPCGECDARWSSSDWVTSQFQHSTCLTVTFRPSTAPKSETTQGKRHKPTKSQIETNSTKVDWIRLSRVRTTTSTYSLTRNTSHCGRLMHTTSYPWVSALTSVRTFRRE